MGWREGGRERLSECERELPPEPLLKPGCNIMRLAQRRAHTYVYTYICMHIRIYVTNQVATFEDALKDAAAEIDELREKVSVNEREKRVATLDASASKTLLSGLHAEAQVCESAHPRACARECPRAASGKGGRKRESVKDRKRK